VQSEPIVSVAGLVIITELNITELQASVPVCKPLAPSNINDPEFALKVGLPDIVKFPCSVTVPEVDTNVPPVNIIDALISISEFPPEKTPPACVHDEVPTVTVIPVDCVIVPE
jgi:hypothetical protein